MKNTKILHGINYNPTWKGWTPGGKGQLSDSDFFNDAFEALWNKGETSGKTPHEYRNDLGTISHAGLNLIRLFNWGPTRGWNGTKGIAHINALDRAHQLGIKVIVPVSNYFLSDDTYSWNEKDPDSNYKFESAPQSIQSDLNNFISSVTVKGKIHPAVHSFSVGNEIDLNNMIGQGTSGYVSPTSRLKRVIWWFINLNQKISNDNILFTCPFSDGDQGGTATSAPSYWFQAIVNGVTSKTNLPHGTVAKEGDSTFESDVIGLSTSAPTYTNWYYNSVNIYTTGNKLTSTIAQYDNWQANSKNTLNWPGEQFSVPLMLTEVGYNRGDGVVNKAAQEKQYTNVLTGIVKSIKNYLSRANKSLLIGYCIYEFNDEAYLNANFGMDMYESPSHESGNVLYKASTGKTVTSFGTFENILYPVDELYPVKSTSGNILLDEIEKTISEALIPNTL